MQIPKENLVIDGYQIYNLYHAMKKHIMERSIDMVNYGFPELYDFHKSSKTSEYENLAWMFRSHDFMKAFVISVFRHPSNIVRLRDMPSALSYLPSFDERLSNIHDVFRRDMKYAFSHEFDLFKLYHNREISLETLFVFSFLNKDYTRNMILNNMQHISRFGERLEQCKPFFKIWTSFENEEMLEIIHECKEN